MIRFHDRERLVPDYWRDGEETTGKFRRLLPCFRSKKLLLSEASLDRVMIGRGGARTFAFECRYRDVSSGRAGSASLFVTESSGGMPESGGDRSGVDPESGAHLHLSPEDPVLRTEIDRSEREWKILGHRPGKRITFLSRRGVEDDAPAEAQIVKYYAGRRATKLIRNLDYLAREWGDSPFRHPVVLRFERAEGPVRLRHIPGESCLSLLENSGDVDFHLIGLALKSLHRCEPVTWSHHSRTDEYGLLRAAADHLHPFLPEIASGIEEGLERLREDSRRIPEGPPVLAHRDFYDKQIVFGGEGLAIIDWDNLAAAPAALDMGNFLAHLTLRELQGQIGRSSSREAGTRFLRGYLETDGGPSPAEIDLYERASLIRLAGVYALRPRWGDLPERLLTRAQRLTGGRVR